MAKFALTCPHCGTLNRASTFIFAKKTIVCEHCKNAIDVKSNRMSVGNCPTCGSVAFDQKKRDSHGNYKCPICNSYSIHGGPNDAINSVGELMNAPTTPLFSCPECYCSIQIQRGSIPHGSVPTCPVCDHKFAGGYGDIFNIIQKEKLVNEVGVSVIKYEGDNSTFVWKHPIEDFNLGTQLIVHESQEAIFFLNGQALDTFGPGRYTLETENLPILKKTYELPTGRQNPFHAEVYFINQTVQMGLKWGTKDRINFIEPETGLPLDIGVSGEMSLRVCDSRRLLVKLVGSMRGISYDNGGKNFTQSLRESFLPMLQTTIKANIGSIIKAQRLNILEIDQHLEEFSVALREKLVPSFEEYGLTLPQFYVNTVALDGENFNKYRGLISDAYLKIRAAEIQLDLERVKAEQARVAAAGEADVERLRGFAHAEVMAAQGYNHKDEIQAEVQKAYAAGIGQMGGNGGSGGGTMSEVIGLGVGLAAMGAMGHQVGGAMNQFTAMANDSTTTSSPAPVAGWQCSCGSTGNTGKFCAECGKAKPEAWDCPRCGSKGNNGKFCSECGTAKPEAWDCPHCGSKGNNGKFCSECGKAKDAPAETKDTWDCSCGATGITGKFCSECGKKKEDNE